MMNQTRIGALLHKDHMATVETLQALDDLLHRHRTPPVVAGDVGEVLARLKSTLRAEVEKHFGFEENHLFPVFIAQGETGIVMMLTQEHRAILPLATQIADGSEQALTDGFDDESWKAFRAAGAELVEREMFHIQKEEMGLLSAISALVDPTTDASLAETYTQVVG